MYVMLCYVMLCYVKKDRLITRHALHSLMIMLSALLQRLAWLAEFQVPDSSLCQWNLDSGFQSLVALRTPTAVFRIPKPRIPDFTGKTLPDSGNPDSLIKWGERQSSYILPKL